MQEQSALSPEAVWDKLIEHREAELERAKTFLKDFLADRQLHFSSDLHAAAAEAQISPSLLYRAKEELPVYTMRMPEQHARAVWYWYEDDQDAQDEADVDPDESYDLTREQLVSELGETIRDHFVGN
jgi:hypothetical protein